MNNAGRMFLFEEGYIKPNTIGVEIGVWKGNFSELILSVSKPTKLHLIDPWKHPPEYQCASSEYEETPNRLRSVYKDLIGETLFIHQDYSQDAVNGFEDSYFDWVYVDGDHSFEGAYLDLKLYTPKLKKNGLMICDDYSNKGPWRDGVILAIDKAVDTGLLVLIEIRNEQAILMKPSSP